MIEDDALPSANGEFQEFLSQAWQELPKDYDIFYLWIHPKFREKALKACKTESNHYVTKGMPQYGTLGYMVSKAGRLKILERIKKKGACTGLCGKQFAPAIDRVLQEMVLEGQRGDTGAC